MPIKPILSDLYVDGTVTVKELSIDGGYSLPQIDGSSGQILSTDGAGTVSFINISTLGLLDPSSIVNGDGLTWSQISPGILQGDVDLSPFSTTDLVEGSRLYFTNERVDDRVNALLLAGTGITKSYNDVANSLTLGVTLAPFSTTDLVEGTRLYFTNERVDDRVNDLIQDSASITWTYDDSLNTLTANAVANPLNVQQDAVSIGSRGTLDFITGSNTTLTVLDDNVNNKVTVQIDSAVGAFDDLSDVTINSPSPGDIIAYVGPDFQNIPNPAVIQSGAGSGSSVRINNTNTASGNYSTVSGGYLNTASSCYAAVGGGLGNTASGYHSAIAGGNSNVALGNESFIGGGLCNSAGGQNSTVSGGVDNRAGSDFSTVSGGCSNTASCNYSIISGGYANTASGYSSTVSGGYANTASGPYSTIGGGRGNSVNTQCSTVSGGYANTVSGYTSVIGGGSQNTVSGDYSTIAGGFCNSVNRSYASILGGICNRVNNSYASIIGCNITSVCDSTLHVNYLNLYNTPTVDSRNTAVLTRNSSTGQVEMKYTGALYVQITDSSAIAAEITEKSLISTGVGTLSVPANGFSVGDSFTVTMGGLISSANSETITIKVKSGAVVLADTTAISLPGLTNRNWRLRIDMTIRSIGAAGVAAIISNGQFSFANTSFDLLGYDLGGLENTSFDTTILNTLDITGQWGSTNATNSIKSTLFVLEKMF